MATKKVNDDGTITWTYSWDEWPPKVSDSVEVDADLYWKDKLDDWNRD